MYRHCAYCGNSFWVPDSEKDLPDSAFCSAKCDDADWIERKEKEVNYEIDRQDDGFKEGH